MDPYSPAARLAGLVLRTAHLLTMAVFVGGVQLGMAGPELEPWRTYAFLTGAALLGSEFSHGRNWLWQVRGLAALAHVAALGLLALGGLDRTATALAVVIGAVGSHAPRSVRKWSVVHRRVVD